MNKVWVPAKNFFPIITRNILDKRFACFCVLKAEDWTNDSKYLADKADILAAQIDFKVVDPLHFVCTCSLIQCDVGTQADGNGSAANLRLEKSGAFLVIVIFEIYIIFFEYVKHFF